MNESLMDTDGLQSELAEKVRLSSEEPGEMLDVETQAAIDILPDEILENIFGRLLPYDDLDTVRIVCQRWNRVARKVVTSLKAAFEKSFHDGSLKCETISTVYDDGNRVVGPWISERFGHMCCYYDRSMYVIGGTAHTPTTFNDMWKFDLNTRSWNRCVASGKYPSPKALASFVQYKDKCVLFGGWAHPPPYPLMQPWRIFDELHIYDIPTKRWSQVITSQSPHPSAGHSASVHRDLMIVFGGRIFNQQEQSYPISNATWVFNFLTGEWYEVLCSDGELPVPRYGQTQIVVDDSHALIIGGCDGTNGWNKNKFGVWLLKLEHDGRNYRGTWTKMVLRNPKNDGPHHDFHYSGCKVGSTVVFCERASPLSPFLAFLHFDSWRPAGNHHPTQLQPGNLDFESSSRSPSYFHSRCSSGVRQQNTATMLIYSLDISKVLTDGTVEWSKEPDPPYFNRPKERMLYSMVHGRAELILFGGFFKDPNGVSCRVSNDVFVLKTVHKNY